MSRQKLQNTPPGLRLDLPLIRGGKTQTAKGTTLASSLTSVEGRVRARAERRCGEGWGVLFALLLFFLLPSATHAATLVRPPNNLNLVGYWSFDEGTSTIVSDLSGNKNNGTLPGGTNNPTWVAGKHGKALDFASASGQYVTVGNPSSLQLTSSISMCAWVYPTARSRFFFSKSDGNIRDYAMYINGSGLLTLFGGGTSQTSSGALTLNTWNYGCITVSGTSVAFYINGAASGTGTITLTNSNKILAFGRDGSNATFHYDGKLDDVRVYSRALTAAQVKALYQSGQTTRKVVSNRGLVGAWNFNEGVGTKAGDSSGNGNTGTITGATWVSGKHGSALSFNGSSNYVSLGQKITSSEGAISLWVKLNGNPDNNDVIISQGAATDGLLGLGFQLTTSGGNKVLFGVNGNLTEAVAISTNVWTHLTGTWGAGGVKLYINGVNLGSNAYTGAATANAGNFLLEVGAYNYSGGRLLYTAMVSDDVKIYNRALSAAEVATLYKQGESKINSSQTGKLTSGLVGMWSFDGKDLTDKVYDRSGQGNHGYIIGVATSSAKTIGKVGQALSFDGVDDHVRTSMTTNLDSGMTIVGWIKPRFTSGNDTILGNGRTVDAGYWSFYYTTGGRIQWGKDGSTDMAARSSPVFSNGSWQQFAMTWTGGATASTDVIFYRNGSVVTHDLNTNGVSLVADSGTQKWIGAATNPANYFEGDLDEVRVYNRVLTADEVKQLYLMGK